MCDLGLRAIITPTEALLRVKVGALNNYGRLTGETSGCMVALHEPDVRSLNQRVALHELGGTVCAPQSCVDSNVHNSGHRSYCRCQTPDCSLHWMAVGHLVLTRSVFSINILTGVRSTQV